ncbi:uncharacterized protein N7529_008186, partial [Penicillium soppii]|uniref:uncharacterized protein n=1 Tax=Penicillium soppii TaxID=69789 RepID=UPI002546931A
NMQYIFTSLVYILCFMNVMVEGLTRYQTSPPTDINPNGLLHAENGGYYLKDMEDVVVAIASDDLCNELDGALASAKAAVDAHQCEQHTAAKRTRGANFTEERRSFLLPQLYTESLQSSSLLPPRYLFELLSLQFVRYPEGLSLRWKVMILGYLR